MHLLTALRCAFKHRSALQCAAPLNILMQKHAIRKPRLTGKAHANKGESKAGRKARDAKGQGKGKGK